MPDRAARAVFFVSDSTGITAETLGNALLSNFPAFDFARRTLPFVDSVARAREVVQEIDDAAAGAIAPLVFTTVRTSVVQRGLQSSKAVTIDLLHGHLAELERVLETPASEHPGRYHGIGDAAQYHERMRAVEYALEHDDGQSVRSLGEADIIIIAPSRCGKTPTTMYLALQYGLLVANYPLTDDDLPAQGLPQPIAPHAQRCFGLITTPQRLSQVRQERRPGSRYASLEQCTSELRHAEDLYRRLRIPYLNSATKSVEEMAAVMLHTMNPRAERPLSQRGAR